MSNFIKYMIIGLVISLSFVLIVNFSPEAAASIVQDVGILDWLGAVLYGIFAISIPMFIGYTFLKFVRPDAYLSSGAVDSFKKRIFWSVGPQSIGLFLGILMLGKKIEVTAAGLPFFG